MPYTIIDAMQDEVDFIRKMAKVEKKAERLIISNIYKAIANSHQRVINSVKSGYDYSLEIVDGEITSVHKRSDRKTLEQEYPALKSAADQYELIKNLVDSTPENKG